ncbi:hypothetical protein Desfe_1045 [Desulfurococcus amylolyticus DSM 16532]|uniref:Uncharacterized protein n=1 Tax=Desulfurococcus amylolyticus DSM 16532 TaxID=768672 RepID=I3XSJ4_DESAM|nr:hypothetical protein Desfe_1045 [Desulfurococcus amylolyticus DSM 16532]
MVRAIAIVKSWLRNPEAWENTKEIEIPLLS